MSLFPRLMAIVPFGIGMTVLIFLWSAPFGDFYSPPLFFRVFGSFVALSFVLTGIGIFVGAGKFGDPRRMAESLQEAAKSLADSQRTAGSSSTQSSEAVKPKVGYDCPNCGAALGKEADVSPSGDVKCGYCERWFNIHSVG
ncbi:MAG: hypothetical protein HQ518_12480 [Rhodopirellula sp.]|nr:hypothetical protein [Rhodopirellula sp.]